MWYTKSQITLKIKVLEEMSVINAIENKYKKPHVVDVRSGDTVRVHQKVREGSKERIQIFEGLVIKTAKAGSHTASITVRRIASGVGVEKTYLVHSPLITKLEVVKRSKVRRNYLSYMRARTGKSARLTSVDFDQEEVNKIPEPEQPKEEQKPEEKVEAEETPETAQEESKSAEQNQETKKSEQKEPAETGPSEK
jgi:large subunit ribosomal protein L19